MTRTMKSSFGTVCSSMGDLDTYAQWEYTMEDGTDVLLAMNERKIVVIADRSDCFIVVEAHNFGYAEKPFEKSEAFAQDFAELFDFSFHSLPVAQDWKPAETEPPVVPAEPLTYAGYVRGLLARSPGAVHCSYGYTDLDGDGNEEMIVFEKDGNFYWVLTMVDGEAVPVYLNMNFLEGHCRVCEGGIIEVSDPSWNMEAGEEAVYYGYVQLQKGQPVTVEAVRQVKRGDGSDTWLHTDGEGMETAITEGEAREIMASYRTVEVEKKPLSDYPLD